MTDAHVHIWTHWHGEEWSGEVEVPDTHRRDQLEFLFRYFNRVEGDDDARLADIGYGLPSLSMGDVVTIDGERWTCAALGWKRA